MTELDKPPYYLFYVGDAFILSEFTIPSSLIIFILTNDVRTCASIIKAFIRKLRNETSKEIIVNIIGLLNAIILSLTYISHLISISDLMVSLVESLLAEP